MTKLHFILVGLSLSGPILFFVWFALTSVSHFDISDEGLYLLAAENGFGPRRFGSGFGAVTGVLYASVGGDLTGFRLLGLLVMIAANASLAWGTILCLPAKTSRRGVTFAFLLITVLPSVTYYTHFPLITPSYNWSSQVGLTLFAAAVLLLTQSRFRFAGDWMLFLALAGVGLSVALWSKPTTVLLYPLLLTLLLIFGRPNRGLTLRLVAIAPSALIVALLYSQLVSDPISEVRRALSAYEGLKAIDPNYGLIQSLEIWLETSAPVLAGAVVGYSFLGLVLAIVQKTSVKNRAQILRLVDYAWLTSVLLTMAVISIATIAGKTDLRQLPFLYFLTLLWIALRGILSFLSARSAGRKIAPESIALAVLISTMPAAHGLGSNNGVSQLSLALGLSVGLGFAVFVGSGRAPHATLAVAAATTGVFVACLTLAAAQNPYRSSPLVENTSLLQIGGGAVYVNPTLAENLEALKICAQNSGLTRETLILDFTYWSPGVVFFLEARAPATLIVAAKEGSDFSKFALELESRKSGLLGLKEAWILLPSVEQDPLALREEIASTALSNIDLNLSGYSSACSTPRWRLYAPGI